MLLVFILTCLPLAAFLYRALVFHEGTRAYEAIHGGRHDPAAAAAFAFNPYRSPQHILAGRPGFPVNLWLGGGWIRALLSAGLWVWMMLAIRSEPDLRWYAAVGSAFPGGGLIAAVFYNIRLARVRAAVVRSYRSSTDDGSPPLPCAGLARAVSTVCGIAAIVGAHAIGVHGLGLATLVTTRPVWDARGIGFAVGLGVVALIASMIGMAVGLRIKVRSEANATFLTILWHTVAINACNWLLLFGAVVGWRLGKETMTGLFDRLGVGTVATQLLLAGAAVGLIAALIQPVLLRLRLPLPTYLIPAGVAAALVARWQWQQWELAGDSWWMAGLFPLLSYGIAGLFIVRDLQARRRLADERT